MKTFNLPVSDCGCFIVGSIGPDSFEPPPETDKPYPEFGIIVWYETQEAAQAAAKAACDAHWPKSNSGNTVLR